MSRGERDGRVRKLTAETSCKGKKGRRWIRRRKAQAKEEGHSFVECAVVHLSDGQAAPKKKVKKEESEEELTPEESELSAEESPSEEEAPVKKVSTQLYVAYNEASAKKGRKAVKEESEELTEEEDEKPKAKKVSRGLFSITT